MLTRFGVHFKAMGGVNEVQLFAPSKEVAEAAFVAVAEEVRRIEAKYSRFTSEGIVAQINRSAGGSAIAVDEETQKLLTFADATFHDSDGTFDITSGAVQKLWNFKGTSIPDLSVIKNALARVGWGKVEWCPPAIRLPEVGMSIDLGGIGKEYAVDRAAEMLSLQGYDSGFLNFAGDIRVLGPRPDGTPWGIGIVNPRKTDEALLTLSVKRGAVATSGDYERYIEVDGKRYCHILDPRTGFPQQSVWSVSVIADSCLIAGALSTAAMLLGYEAGERLLRRAHAPFVMVGDKGVVTRLDLAKRSQDVPYVVLKGQ